MSFQIASANKMSTKARAITSFAPSRHNELSECQIHSFFSVIGRYQIKYIKINLTSTNIIGLSSCYHRRSFSWQTLSGSFFMNTDTHLTSTSGLLCLSTTCDEKFSTHMEACKVFLTASRYGFRVDDYKIEITMHKIK